MSKNRVFAIGDIHGCSTALQRLLDEIQPTEFDTIITLGDYIDRGPDSKGVVERLIKLSKETNLIPIMGNHEEMVIQARTYDGESAFNFWMRVGGMECARSYGGFESARDFPDRHYCFIRFDCKPFYQTDTHIFVHACYDPTKPPEEYDTRMLRWSQPEFETIQPHCSGKRVILGHSEQLLGLPLHKGHVTCIDTYCYSGLWLTALEVDTDVVLQANEQGAFRTFPLQLTRNEVRP